MYVVFEINYFYKKTPLVQVEFNFKIKFTTANYKFILLN